jgi:pimeloyl-ACP methyl ester carboxylesterase
MPQPPSLHRLPLDPSIEPEAMLDRWASRCERSAPDGRTLAYAVWGDPEGFPILALHGTPGCRLGRWPREELYADLGVCHVTHDRAAYGQSDPR